MTIACKSPNSRSRTFIYMRIKKDFVVLEYAGIALPVYTENDFNEDTKASIKKRFNEMSIKKI